MKFVYLSLILFCVVACNNTKNSEKATQSKTPKTSIEDKPAKKNVERKEEQEPPYILLMNTNSPLLGTSTGFMLTKQAKAKLITPLIAGGGNQFEKVSMGGANQNQLVLKTPDFEMKYQLFHLGEKKYLWAVYEKLYQGKWICRLLTSNSKDAKRLNLKSECPSLFNNIPILNNREDIIPQLFSLDSLGFRARKTGKIVLRFAKNKLKVDANALKELVSKTGAHLKQQHPCDVTGLNLQAEVSQEIQKSKMTSISPKSQMVAYLKENKLHLYNPQTQKTKILYHLNNRINKITPVQWSPKEDNLAFVELNPKKYPTKTAIVNINLESSDSSKSVFIKELNIAYQQNPKCNFLLSSDFSFFDNNTLQYPTKSKVYKYGFINLVPKSTIKPYYIETLGYNGFGKYYYGVYDENKSLLDSHIQQILIKNSYILNPSVSPDGASFIYLAKGATNTEYALQIHYPEATQNHTKSLLTLQLNTESSTLSNALWSPDGSKVALVHTQSASAPFAPTTLYVLDVKNARILKQENVQLPMHCNHNGCTVEAKKAFWFKDENTLQYKKGASETEAETITLNLN